MADSIVRSRGFPKKIPNSLTESKFCSSGIRGFVQWALTVHVSCSDVVLSIQLVYRQNQLQVTAHVACSNAAAHEVFNCYYTKELLMIILGNLIRKNIQAKLNCIESRCKKKVMGAIYNIVSLLSELAHFFSFASPFYYTISQSLNIWILLSSFILFLNEGLSFNTNANTHYNFVCILFMGK